MTAAIDPAIKNCRLCPLACGVDRAVAAGRCGVGGLDESVLCGRSPYFSSFVARAARHYFEEPPISGTRGSGTIFFSGCNMACIFCQNRAISHSVNGAKGRIVNETELAEAMLRLEALGSHNINLVTPSPHIALIERAIPLAKKRGLSIPIIYNTSAYDAIEALERLDGLIDIYLPDLKYKSAIASKKYSAREDYFAFASRAVIEMQRQCGVLQTDETGVAVRGLIVRHLVLPGSVDEARAVLDFIHTELPRETHISLMSQYTPMGDALPPPIDRRLLKREYDRALDYAIALGFMNIYAQALSSAQKSFTPEFNGFFE